MVKHLPKSELITGEYYYGSCRNADTARWNGKTFIYLRYKFGDRFWEEINHPEDDDGFDLFYPKHIIDYGVIAIPLTTQKDYVPNTP